MGSVSDNIVETNEGASERHPIRRGWRAPMERFGAVLFRSGKTDSSENALRSEASSDEISEREVVSPIGGKSFLGAIKGIQSVFSACLELPNSVIISSFFINRLGLALPLVVLQVYDRIIPNTALATLAYLMVGLMIVIVLETSMKIARAYVMGWRALHTSYCMEVEAVRRILRSPLPALDRDAASVWMDRLDALAELNGFYGGPARLILLDLPFLAIFLIMMLLVGGLMVAIPITMILIFALITAVRSAKIQAVLQERSDRDAKRFDFITECLAGIETIKCMAMEPQMLRRFERLQQGTADVSHRMILHGDTMQSIGSLFASMTMIATVTIGAIVVMTGYLSIGALACCTLLSGRIIQPVLRSIGIWNEMQNIAILHESADQLFALAKTGQTAKTGEQEIQGKITIKDLSCQHPVTEHEILSGLSLNVAVGECIGIRGNFDGGQSVLAQAIRGELIPDEGTVHIDGINVAGKERRSIASSICYLPDRPFIFRGTILENIAMFRQGAALDVARNAARLIGLESSIHRLPEGYDTPIGDGITDSLSAGLMQRIAIARAIAQQPKILIFDEANRSLDFQSDAQLRKGLEQLKGKMTILLICNRPSLLAIADHIYELRDRQLYQVALEDAMSQETSGQPA